MMTLFWSFSGPYFLAFGLNTERYGVSLRIQSEWGKMGTRKTPNTDTFSRSLTNYYLFLINRCTFFHAMEIESYFFVEK